MVHKISQLRREGGRALKEWEQLEEESHSAIHLLRGLLRECSYLPDPAARAYLHPYIVSRFREYHPHRGGKQASLKRRKGVLENGKKQFRLLQRANQGELRPLEKVLLVTYGRIGKRRHELMAPLLQPGQPLHHPQDVGTVMGEDNIKPRKSLEKAPSTITKGTLHMIRTLNTNDIVSTRPRVEVGKARENGTPIEIVPERIVPLPNKRIALITPQLEALARSQRLAAPAEVTRSNPKEKDLTLQIPGKNVWSRPLAINRQVNMVKKWYANLLDHILPPVSDTEWNRLRDLASGKLKWEGLRKRRPAAKPISPAGEKENVVVNTRRALFEKDPIVPRDGKRLTPYVQSPRSALTTEIGITKVRPDKSERIRGHNITARFMRRLWGKIFAQCPVMTWDSAKSQWQVVWGHTSVTSSDQVKNARSVDLSMFKGVDEQGEPMELSTKADRTDRQQNFPRALEEPLDRAEASPADNARGNRTLRIRAHF